MIPLTLIETLSKLGLPTPRSMKPLWTRNGIRDTAILFGDTMSEAYILRRQAVDSWGGLRLERELAAYCVLEDADLPTPKGYRILRDQLGATAICPTVEGAAGVDVLRRRPDLAPVVFTLIGHAMRGVHNVALPHWGQGAAAKRFLPTAESAGREWVNEARHHLRQAQNNGTGLGALGERLLEAVQAAEEVISAQPHITLVHRRMAAHMIWLQPLPDGEVGLTGVLDWGDAIAGDPLADWAPSLFAPVGLFARVLRGYGPDKANALLTAPTAEARLLAYGAAFCLREMSQISAEGAARSRAVQSIRERAQRLSKPIISEHIRAAMDAVPDPQPAPRTDPDIGQAFSWRVLDGLRTAVPVDRRHTARLIAAMSTHRLAPTEAFAARAHNLLEPFPITGQPIHGHAHENWHQHYAQSALKGPNHARRHAVILTGLALHALDATTPILDDGQRLGLSRYTAQLRHLDHQATPLSNRDSFLHALVALALLDAIEAAADSVNPVLKERLEQQLTDGWFAIEPMTPSSPKTPWTETINTLSKADWEQSELGDWTPSVLFAIRLLHDRLPASAEEVLEALQLRIGETVAV